MPLLCAKRRSLLQPVRGGMFPAIRGENLRNSALDDQQLTPNGAGAKPVELLESEDFHHGLPGPTAGTLWQMRQ